MKIFASTETLNENCVDMIPVQIFGPHKNPHLSISVLNTNTIMAKNTIMADNNTVDTNTNLEGKDSRLKANTTWYVQCQPLPLQVFGPAIVHSCS